MQPNTVSSRMRHLYAFLRYLVDREVAHTDLLKRKLRVKVPEALPRPWTRRVSRNSWPLLASPVIGP